MILVNGARAKRLRSIVAPDQDYKFLRGVFDDVHAETALETAPAVIEAGAVSVKVISDLLTGGDPAARVRLFLAALGERRTRSKRLNTE